MQINLQEQSCKSLTIFYYITKGSIIGVETANYEILSQKGRQLIVEHGFQNIGYKLTDQSIIPFSPFYFNF
jgi:hypothetical protein